MTRQSINPTYDSRETGPRYWVTTEIDGQAVEFCKPLDDPFVRKTISVEWRWVSWLPWLRRNITITVTVGADKELMDDVLELDSNQLVAGRTRRDEFHRGMHTALGQFGYDRAFEEIVANDQPEQTEGEQG